MGNICSTHEEEEFDVKFKESVNESKGINNNRQSKAHLYSQGGANLGRSSILPSVNPPLRGSKMDDKDPNSHRPVPDTATEISEMNAYSAQAAKTEASLPLFDKTKSTHPTNPTFGPYRYKESGDTYTGQYFRGQRMGFGELVTNSGECYVGHWDFDQINGIGRLIFPNGDHYEGEFKGSKANGKGVFISAVTGIKYDGEFKDDKQEGKGKEKYPDGSFYYGEFVNDMKHGIGNFRFSDGGQYTGRFINDNISGQGKYIYTDGKVYEGEWKNNLKHGTGAYDLGNGMTYRGGFFEGKRKGKGSLRW